MKNLKLKDLPLELREFAVYDDKKNVKLIEARQSSVDAALLFKFYLTYDSFKQQIYLNDKVYDPAVDYDIVADSLCSMGFKITNQFLQLLRRRICCLAKKYSFDSGYQALSLLPEWDGVDRWNTLAEYLGIDNPLWGRFLFVSIIYRLKHAEGVQHQFMHILHGSQGCGKSTFFELISLKKDMFTREVDFFDSTDCIARALKGISVVEIPELLGKGSRSDDYIKTMLSKDYYQYRPLYTETIEKVTLRNVFCGTTNEQNFLTDKTGNRRFIVATVTKPKIDLSAIKNIKDQLYAQAKAELQDLSCYQQLIKEVQEYNVKNNAAYEVRSIYYETLLKFEPEELHLKTSTDILVECFGVKPKDITQRQLNEINKAMRNLGFTTCLKRINEKVARFWFCE